MGFATERVPANIVAWLSGEFKLHETHPFPFRVCHEVNPLESRSTCVSCIYVLEFSPNLDCGAARISPMLAD